jgi:hypothetical protein
MLAKAMAILCMAGIALGVIFVAFALCAEPTEGTANKPESAATKPADGQQAPAETVEEKHRVPVAVARERAELMHRMYSATLDVLHDRYFHDSRAMVPARAMEDIFAEMARQSQVEARWIAVNMRAMSLSHEPRDDFEKAAAKEITAGKEHFESIENGYYRRAGAIPLGSNCVNCHAGFFKEPPKTPRFAGLVISVPVTEQ